MVFLSIQTDKIYYAILIITHRLTRTIQFSQNIKIRMNEYKKIQNMLTTNSLTHILLLNNMLMRFELSLTVFQWICLDFNIITLKQNDFKTQTNTFYYT